MKENNIKQLKENFNSIKVRLELVSGAIGAPPWLFQFHKGAIRTTLGASGIQGAM